MWDRHGYRLWFFWTSLKIVCSSGIECSMNLEKATTNLCKINVCCLYKKEASEWSNFSFRTFSAVKREPTRIFMTPSSWELNATPSTPSLFSVIVQPWLSAHSRFCFGVRSLCFCPNLSNVSFSKEYHVISENISEKAVSREITKSSMSTFSWAGLRPSCRATRCFSRRFVSLTCRMKNTTRQHQHELKSACLTNRHQYEIMNHKINDGQKHIT